MARSSPASTSLLDWALRLEQEREKEPVGCIQIDRPRESYFSVDWKTDYSFAVHLMVGIQRQVVSGPARCLIKECYWKYSTRDHPKYAVNDAGEGLQLGTPRRGLSPLGRRHPIDRHIEHNVPVQPKLP